MVLFACKSKGTRGKTACFAARLYSRNFTRMIQTTVKTEVNGKDVRIPIPAEYAGKELHILVYSDEEIDHVAEKAQKTLSTASSYFGTLSKEVGEKLQEDVRKSREQWERDF